MLKGTAYRTAGPPSAGPAVNRKKTNLGKEAVKAALQGDWERAVEANRALLELNPRDCEASNRLAKALMELGQYAEARQILEALCARAPHNNIARKNLARLEQFDARDGDPRPSTSTDDGLPRMFIAESGKSCTTTLRRTADAAPPAAVRPGDVVVLRKRGEGVEVLTQRGDLLGVVDRRLGRRLHKLMNAGNQYAAAVVGTGPEGVAVILREVKQHPTLRNVVSFPSAEGNLRPRATAIADPPAVETRDEEPHSAALDAAGDDPMDDEAGVVAEITDEVADDTPDDDAVPVLDTDVDEGDSWESVMPARDEEADWE